MRFSNCSTQEEITPTTLLKDPEKLNQITHQLSSPDKDRQAGPSVLSQAPPTTPPPPQYSYQEINVTSLAGLAGLIKINPQVNEDVPANDITAHIRLLRSRG